MKKKHPEHVNLERWLVSYADFITLMFAFFVIMYAMAQSDSKKLKKVSESIRRAFSYGPVGMLNLGGTSGGNTINSFDLSELPGGRMVDLPAGQANTAAEPDSELQEVRELLEETVSLELGVTEISDKLQMQFDSRGLVVRVSAKDFFDDGAVDIRTDFQPLIEKIGSVLSKTNRLIRLEGHTDFDEKKPSRFKNDWEFSAARAAWVADYWIKNFEFQPQRIGVAGYASFRSLAKPETPQDDLARSKNRRIEIILLRNQFN